MPKIYLPNTTLKGTMSSSFHQSPALSTLLDPFSSPYFILSITRSLLWGAIQISLTKQFSNIFIA